MNLQIDVTEQDIKQGIRFNPSYCPIALAIQKKLKQDYWAMIGGKKLEIFFFRDSSHCVNYSTTILPLECNTFTSNFDRGDNVEPFSFVVQVPEHCLKETNQ